MDDVLLLMLTPGGNWLLLVKPRTSRLCCLDQAGKRILWFVGFPLVYKSRIHCISQLWTSFNTMVGCSPGSLIEDLLEVRTAGTDHYFVGPHRGVLAHDDAVHQ